MSLISRVCSLTSLSSIFCLMAPWPLIDLWPIIPFMCWFAVGEICWQSKTSGYRLSWRHFCQLLQWNRLGQTLLEFLSRWLLWERYGKVVNWDCMTFWLLLVIFLLSFFVCSNFCRSFVWSSAKFFVLGVSLFSMLTLCWSWGWIWSIHKIS